MKKHNLFKAIVIVLFVVLIATYFLPTRDGADSFTYLGIGDLFINSIQSLYYFFDIALFTLVVGGFYGILNKTGAYRKLLDVIVSKFKRKGEKFIIATICIFAIITALTGFTYPLIMFIPIFISIILMLGYDKLVALSATVGASLIGFIGGIFIPFRDATGYTFMMTTMNELLGVKFNETIFPKIFLLFAGIALLILYVLKHIKNSKKENLELKDDSDIFITEVKSNYKDIKIWPIIIILSLLVVIIILGLVPWSTLEITAFDDFHDWLLKFKIGEYTVFNILSLNFVALGTWLSLGNYLMLIIVLLVFALILKFVYKIKLDTCIDSFVDGMKKMLPAALLITLAQAVLVCVYNHGMLENIITSLVESTNGFNLPIATFISMLGSFLGVDFFYAIQAAFQPLITALGDTTTISILDILFQSAYGFTMLFVPTSLLLITGLTYLKVPYKTWLKYIWKFLLELFIVIYVVLLIVSLM
ncbi:MAG: hypothetical protein Q4G04_05800 [bacterium]|nr:hypothetical protein [bacterium]